MAQGPSLGPEGVSSLDVRRRRKSYQGGALQTARYATIAQAIATVPAPGVASHGQILSANLRHWQYAPIRICGLNSLIPTLLCDA